MQSGLFKTNVELFKKTFKSFFEDDMDMYAAALAFQMLFAIVPFLIVFISILGFLDMEELYRVLYEHAGIIVPERATEVVVQFVGELEEPTGILLPVALIFALWIASSAMRSTTHILNIVYDVNESRPFWSQFLLSIAYTLAITVMLILALLFMILGPQVLEWLTGLVALDEAYITIWAWLRWPVAVILLMLTISIVYYAAPNVKQDFRNIIPGSVLSVLVWIGLSVGFEFYMRTFVDLSILFGGLGAIIFLMIYFYICSAILIFGAVLNAVLDSKSREERR